MSQLNFSASSKAGKKAIRCNICNSLLTSYKKRDMERHRRECNDGITNERHIDVVFRQSEKDSFKYTKSSMVVAYLGVQNQVSYSIPGTYLKESMYALAHIYDWPDSVKNDILLTPLGKDSISNCIPILAEHSRKAQTKSMSSSLFSIMWDETTDRKGQVFLSIVARYIKKDSIEQELLEYCQIRSQTADSVVATIMDVLAKYNLSIKKCVGGCADGASVNTGETGGVVRHLMEKGGSHMRFFHCFLHKENLAVQDTGSCFDDVMGVCVKVVSEIRGSNKLLEVFKQKCLSDGDGVECLKLFTVVRWLSRGGNLRSVYANRSNIKDLFCNSHYNTNSMIENYINCFTSPVWICRLAYLVDIFAILNKTNIAMQGRRSVMHCLDEVSTLLNILRIYAENTKSGVFSQFPNFTEAVSSIGESERKSILTKIKSHLEELVASLERRYPALDLLKLEYAFIRDPFSMSSYSNQVWAQPFVEECVHICGDGDLKSLYNSRFGGSEYEQFWVYLSSKQLYPHIVDKAIRFLLLSCTTWECESTHSVMSAIVPASRNRLIHTQDEMKVRLSSSMPDITGCRPPELCRKSNMARSTMLQNVRPVFENDPSLRHFLEGIIEVPAEGLII